MSKKDNSPAISFFSFQDIITSITGIMFLVVLMLVLNIRKHSPPAPEERRIAAELTELQQRRDELKKRVAACSQRSEELKKRIAELRKLDASALPGRRAQAIARLQQLSCDIAALKAELARLPRQAAELRQLTARTQAELSAAVKQTDAAKIKLKSDLEREKQLTTELTEKKQTMRFVWPKKSNKQPILVECGAKYLRVRGLNAAAAELPIASPDDALPRLLEWSQSLGGPAELYFVLLAKPEAFGYVEHLARQLGGAGYERGREVLPDNTFKLAPGARP